MDYHGSRMHQCATRFHYLEAWLLKTAVLSAVRTSQRQGIVAR